MAECVRLLVRPLETVKLSDMTVLQQVLISHLFIQMLTPEKRPELQ